MDFRIDAAMEARIEQAREWGRTRMRPAGLEADRNGAPLPPDHAYFDAFVAAGKGRTRWRDGDAEGASGEPQRTLLSLLLSEETAYWDRGVVVADPGPSLPEASVLALGTEEQKERYLGPFLELDRPRWACFAMTEPGAGSDAAAIATVAKPDGDGFVINGAKCFIGNASRADWILVQATLDPAKGRAAQRAFFVERGTPGLGGFKIEKKMGLKAYESTSFRLDDVSRARIAAARGCGAQGTEGGLQDRDAHLQRGPSGDRRERRRDRARRARRGAHLRPRARSHGRPSRARSPGDPGAKAPDGTAGLPACRVVGGSGASQHRRGFDGQGRRCERGPGGDFARAGAPRRGRRARRSPDREAVPRREGHGHRRRDGPDPARHHRPPARGVCPASAFRSFDVRACRALRRGRPRGHDHAQPSRQPQQHDAGSAGRAFRRASPVCGRTPTCGVSS